MQNRCSKRPREIHGKKPVLESLFNKATDQGLQLYLKDASAQVLSCEFWKISRNTVYGTPLGNCLSNTVQISLHYVLNIY